jgi:hypothetical protein
VSNSGISDNEPKLLTTQCDGWFWYADKLARFGVLRAVTVKIWEGDTVQLKGYLTAFRLYILPPSSEHINPHVGKFLPITASYDRT